MAMRHFQQLRRRARVAGFTLIELMVTLAVVAVLITIAVPSFESVMNSNRLSSAANEMVAALQTARMEAVRRNSRTVVCFSANANAGTGATCATSGINGWITFVDANSNGTFNSAGDTLLRSSTINTPVKVSGTSTVVYRSDGLAKDSSDALVNGTITVCIPTRNPAQNVRNVSIGSGSRISTQSDTSNGICS